MTKIDFTQTLKNLEGNPIKDLPQNPEQNLTLSKACINALLINIPQDKLTGTEKLERYELAKQIHKNKTLNLTSEQITLLKTLIAKVYGVLPTGQAYEMLEKEPEKNLKILLKIQ